MLEPMMNSAMSTRATEARSTAYAERNPERESSRNGYWIRGLSASLNDVELKIPEPRSGNFLEDPIENVAVA